MPQSRKAHLDMKESRRRTLPQMRGQKAALASQVLRSRPGNKNGIFQDIFDGALDVAEEFGDMVHPGVSKYAKTAKQVRDMFPGLRKSKSVAMRQTAKAVESRVEKAAASAGLVTGAPPSRKRKFFHRLETRKGRQFIVGTELVKLLPAEGYSVGDVIYQVAINPTTLPCPRLKRTVKGFEKYNVRNMRFHIDSACGSSFAGQMAVLIDKDPKDGWLSGGESTARSALSHMTCQLHSLWEDSTISVVGGGTKWVDDSKMPDVVRFDSLGTFVCVCTQAISKGPTLGSISLSYDIEVEQPAENESLATGGAFAFIKSNQGGSVNSSVDVFSSDAEIAAMSSLDVTIASKADGKVTIPTSGSYFVQVSNTFLNDGYASEVIIPSVVGSPTIIFPESVDVYAGSYGGPSPGTFGNQSTSASSDGFFTASYLSKNSIARHNESYVVYTDAPWSMQFANFREPCQFSGMYIWIICLDSLPFATLASAQRVYSARRIAESIDTTSKEFDVCRLTNLHLQTQSSSASTSSATIGSSSSTTTNLSPSTVTSSQPQVSTAVLSSLRSAPSVINAPRGSTSEVPSGYVLVKKDLLS